MMSWGGERELENLSLNLLFAGELEIVTSNHITNKERNTRLKVLKKLAYKAEHLTREEIIQQNTNFIQKVEKGKFKWGSKNDLRAFEQQLVYNISVSSRRQEGKGKGKSNSKFNDRKKYCLDFNRGQCKHDKSHEGFITGQLHMKLHICKHCLVLEGVEANHSEKECPKKK